MQKYHQLTAYGTAFLTLLCILPLLFPVWPALTAGISSLSLAIFAVLAAANAAVFYIFRGGWRYQIIASCAVFVALLGAFTPQLAYGRIAARTHTKLTFDLPSYLHFSGSTTVKPTKTLIYKQYDNQDMKFAFYQNPAPGIKPLVVVLHGGGWRYGNYLETGNWPKLFLDAGYSVASVEYRLANSTYHTWRDAPKDVHDAIVYLQNHSSELSINPTAIALFGQSAGGHLALLEAYQNNSVQHVISLYAPIDPALDYKTSIDKTAEIEFLGGTPMEYPTRYQQLSPLTYVSKNAPRTLLIQGLSDDLVAHQNAQLLGALLEEHNIDHKVLYLPLVGHSFDNQRGGFTTQLAEQNSLRFLASE